MSYYTDSRLRGVLKEMAAKARNPLDAVFYYIDVAEAAASSKEFIECAAIFADALEIAQQIQSSSDRDYAIFLLASHAARLGLVRFATTALEKVESSEMRDRILKEVAYYHVQRGALGEALGVVDGIRSAVARATALESIVNHLLEKDAFASALTVAEKIEDTLLREKVKAKIKAAQEEEKKSQHAN